jgi:shikimate 5-dehydrogenase
MLESFPIIPKSEPTFYFIGVTTGKSSMVKVFPLWMKELGHPEIVLEGIDLKIHDSQQAYRSIMAQIKEDPLSVGGVVTTHKVDLYEAAKDLFDYTDPYAQICGEVSGISKRDGKLEGYATDPISSGLSLDDLLGKGYFGRTGGEVLIFGAGGSAAAILLHLVLEKDTADRPGKVTLVNRSTRRLEVVREMAEKQGSTIPLEIICNQDPLKNDALMAALPEYSVVINATGMGKDIPGSPVTHNGLFPRHGVAWEFNYRGELDFLHQALAQAEPRDVRVEDGWLYFVYGWTMVVAQVLHIDLTPDLFRRMEAVAASVRK